MQLDFIFHNDYYHPISFNVKTRPNEKQKQAIENFILAKLEYLEDDCDREALEEICYYAVTNVLSLSDNDSLTFYF